MRKLFFLALKIAISAGLLYLALSGVNFPAIQARLGSIDLGWIATAVAATVIQLGVAALRWREIANACGAHLSTHAALRFTLVGAFFNQTLPSTIGGDGVRLWLLQRHGTTWQAATYSVLVDRAVGLIVLAAIVVISLPWSLRLIENEHGRLALALLDFAAIAGCIVFLVFGRLSWRWIQDIWPARHLQGCAKLASHVMFDRRIGPRVLLLSLLNHLLSVAIATCAALAIAAPVSFGEMLLLIPPVNLITMVPISIAGWGVREQAMQAAFSHAGLSTADGVTISLLFGAIYFIVGAAGGLAWLLSSEKSAKGAAAMDDEDGVPEPQPKPQA
ncbi:lysylphosphatidylglycerol synthase transmembrane domain-containing protein [Bradyrhizobium sp. LHD-71]|uniref:lysylphosphatidylglycerol synthase transmembrane domain-containing protein n=1 Tax=Bradyrhizobium sp. LHD-71 TaxID=3072141 RepID=UPI00280F03EA|nr:lysylphosphatidylglycerol synthase transmembrane domain-containing protein [Bradyrhizobium sp. LHD-71]MDQ8728436.1 lysylphosphatidylglycerol synthase transmembrane domain-containing protein [Bradyrhizobium sp. LHD-71]